MPAACPSRSSHGNSRIVVNCGLPVDQPRQLAAGGARDRGPFDRDVQRHLVGAVVDRRRGPLKHAARHATSIGGPHARSTVVRARSRPTPSCLRASHDGYAGRFDIVHQRALDAGARRHAASTARTCSCPPSGDVAARRRADQFALRFHLHPSIKANRADRRRTAPCWCCRTAEVWTFNAYDGHASTLEESVYLAGPDGPRRTLQIVIYGRARKIMRVQWAFAAQATTGTPPAPAAAARRSRSCRCDARAVRHAARLSVERPSEISQNPA